MLKFEGLHIPRTAFQIDSKEASSQLGALQPISFDGCAIFEERAVYTRESCLLFLERSQLEESMFVEPLKGCLIVHR